jgi:alkylhydroperoxidase family enzyme
VTLVAQSRVPDDIYEEARRHFSEQELVNLTVAIAAINAWNRIAISFRAVHPVKEAHAA